MSTYHVQMARGGNIVSEQAEEFSLDEAGVPLMDVVGEQLRALGRLDLFVRCDNHEVYIPESERNGMSLRDALDRVAVAGKVVTLDATAAHEGAR
jgi:hypothetical protein